jgi:uncharacterized membrane protein YfcA
MAHLLALFIAAFVAGIINSIAGGGTLITFPILLWTGLDAKMANATSTVALWPGLLGGLWGYRREMQNSRPLLVRLGLTSVCGGALGAWLLIKTPSPVFARLVPFLILFATVLFIAQEPISRRLRLRTPATTAATAHEPSRKWWAGAIIFQFASAIYGGYFGAGNGILMLAALGLLGISDIHKANGVKNYLGMCLNSGDHRLRCVWTCALAGRALDDRERHCRRLLWREHCATARTRVRSPRGDRYRISYRNRNANTH